MVFKVGPHFDAVTTQARYSGPDSHLRFYLRPNDDFLCNPNNIMAWNAALMRQSSAVTAIIVGLEPKLTSAIIERVCDLARISLEREDWKPKTVPLKDDDPRKKWHGQSVVHFEVRPRAWFGPQSLLLFYKWLESGILDQGEVRTMLSKDMLGTPMVEGIWYTDELMPLSAWPEIMELPSTPDPQGNKRKQDATDRLGMMLAEDPGQLHDPKSPARKKARNYMRGSMSQRWLVSGLASTAVNWLRTFEWREGQSGLSPRETLLRAYAYMPEVEAPANIAEEVRQLRLIPI